MKPLKQAEDILSILRFKSDAVFFHLDQPFVFGAYCGCFALVPVYQGVGYQVLQYLGKLPLVSGNYRKNARSDGSVGIADDRL